MYFLQTVHVSYCHSLICATADMVGHVTLVRLGMLKYSNVNNEINAFIRNTVIHRIQSVYFHWVRL